MIIHPKMIEKKEDRNEKKYEKTTHRGVYPGSINKLQFNGESFRSGPLGRGI